MFSRSRAVICVREPDHNVVLGALSRYLRKWDFFPGSEVPPGYVSGDESARQLYWRAADEACPWTTLAIEDIQNALFTAYGLSKVLNDVPVLVSRSYKYGEWHLKIYQSNDCVLKIGDDPDHELAWLATPLSEERVDELVTLVGGGEGFRNFLSDAIDGRPAPQDLEASLCLRALAHGFTDLAEQPSSDWTYATWNHRRS